MDKKNCNNCDYAKWRKTPKGRLSGDGMGQCDYNIEIIIPKAFYYISSGSPKPLGGMINRHRPETDCPTWKLPEVSKP